MTTTLWDTTGGDIVKALHRGAAGRRCGRVRPRRHARRGRRREESRRGRGGGDGCRPSSTRAGLIIVIRAPDRHADRLDAEVQAAGRLGAIEAVVMRMYGRLSLHAESVVLPLLAPDAPVVTWWHGSPPDEIATDPLGVLADRRVTDMLAREPIRWRRFRQRAADFAPGDTDLAWTRDDAVALAAGVGLRRPRPPAATGARVAAGRRQPERRSSQRMAARGASASNRLSSTPPALASPRSRCH